MYVGFFEVIVKSYPFNVCLKTWMLVSAIGFQMNIINLTDFMNDILKFALNNLDLLVFPSCQSDLAAFDRTIKGCLAQPWVDTVTQHFSGGKNLITIDVDSVIDTVSILKIFQLLFIKVLFGNFHWSL